MRTSDWLGADRHLQRAREQGLSDVAWALRKSDWLIAQQRWNEATRMLTALVGTADENDGFTRYAVRHNLASIAFAQGDHAGSVAWLSSLLEHDGVAKAAIKGFRASEILWVKCLHRSGDVPRLSRWVTQIEATGQLAGSVADIAALASCDAGDLIVARRWSTLARTSGVALESTVEALASSAILHLEASDIQRARAISDAACERWPLEGWALASQGLVALAAGEANRASLVFERVAELLPGRGWIFRVRGWARLLSGDAARAEDDFNAALELDGPRAESLGSLAVVHAMEGRAPEARESLCDSRRLDAECLSAHYAEQLLIGSKGPTLDLLALVPALLRMDRNRPTAKASAGVESQRYNQKSERAIRPTVSPSNTIEKSAIGNIFECKIAIVTPTFQRPLLLAQTLRYFLAQDVANSDNLHWFVLDDSPTPNRIGAMDHPRIHYLHLHHRIALGAKRNKLNEMARDWGAAFICSMDDDDWYGPSYVSSMVALLRSSGHLFAGSSSDYYYHQPTGTIMHVPSSAPGHSCNGVLCYSSAALQDDRRYDDTRPFSEESSFLKGAFVAQHPDVGSVHLALAHSGNTVSKAAIHQEKRCRTTLQLSDLPMTSQDQTFYRRLTQSA